MFKNAIIYRIGALPELDLQAIEARALAALFAECGPSQPNSHGWTPPRGHKHSALVEVVGGQWLLRMKSESKTVPAATVKEELEKAIEKIEADTGRKPRGKAKRELKEEIIHTLLPRAFGKRSTVNVWISPEAKLLVVGAGSVSAADLIASAVIELLGGGINLHLLNSRVAPTRAMALWLVQQEPPPGFSIDRECELAQPDSERATVRYARHTLETDEIVRHVEQGKLPTQLAMTWSDRVSFVLTDDMTLKGIEILDVAMTNRPELGEQDDFDADVAVETGELLRLIPDLIEALGGEAAPDLVAQAEQPEAPAAHAPIEGEPDPLIDQARAIVTEHKRASISLVQRHLRIGYNRAARLLEMLEREGVVSAMSTDGSRSVRAETATA